MKKFFRRGNVLEILTSKHNVRIPNERGEEHSEWTWNGYLYLKSTLLAYYYKKDLENVKNFCLFIGYPRSGHSVVGSILDAHKNIIIAHEMDCLTLSERGFDANQIKALLLDNSMRFSEVNRAWSGYDYKIDNAWQGEFKELLVIGDKIGGWSSRLIAKDEEMLDRFKKNIGLNVKFIHHVRNPFDIVSRRVLRRKRIVVNKKDVDDILLLASAIEKVKEKEKKSNFFEGHHEELVKKPEKYIKKLLKFLELESTRAYLKKTTGIVNRKLSQPRYKVIWSDNLINYTKKEMEKYAFFKNYKF